MENEEARWTSKSMSFKLIVLHPNSLSSAQMQTQPHQNFRFFICEELAFQNSFSLKCKLLSDLRMRHCIVNFYQLSTVQYVSSTCWMQVPKLPFPARSPRLTRRRRQREPRGGRAQRVHRRRAHSRQNDQEPTEWKSTETVEIRTGIVSDCSGAPCEGPLALQGPGSIEKFWLDFWLEKWFEISLLF